MDCIFYTSLSLRFLEILFPNRTKILLFAMENIWVFDGNNSRSITWVANTNIIGFRLRELCSSGIYYNIAIRLSWESCIIFSSTELKSEACCICKVMSSISSGKEYDFITLRLNCDLLLRICWNWDIIKFIFDLSVLWNLYSSLKCCS